MSQGGYTHTTRATGTVLTAAIYNNDHQNHIVNQNPQMTGGYSDTLVQMQLMMDPGGLGAESLATSLAGEIERIRYQIRAITGETQWYMPPSQSLGSIGGIGDGSLPITKLAPTAQGKILGRISAGVGPWQEFDIPTLTQLSPVVGDWVLGVPAAGGAPRKIDVSNLGTGTSIEAQGRLTLQAGTPVMSTANSNKNNIIYTPYKGLAVPLWTGTAIIAQSMGGELSQLTTDNTKSPGPVTSDSNYDIFFWMDGGTPRISRGPSWTTNTNRGVGPGTSEITRIQGLLVNAQAIVNGPAANRGTYLGSIHTSAAATVNWVYGGNGGGGVESFLHVWNMYHRCRVMSKVSDTTINWLYSGSTWRIKFGSDFNKINFMSGLAEDAFSAVNVGGANTNSIDGTIPRLGVGFDTPTPSPPNALVAYRSAGAGDTDLTADMTASNWVQTMGAHYFCASESSGGGTCSFIGSRHGAIYGITFDGWM
jgi:hypothetical protein